MAADSLATLSLALTNAPAIADAKATGAAFEDMGNKGEAAQKKIVAFSNPVTEAVKKQAVTVEQSRAAWAASGGDMHKFALELKAIADAANPVPPALNHITDSTRRMTLMQMEAISINEKMGAGAVQHKLTLGRLGNQFESLTAQIAGVHPVVGKVVSVMGDFALGSVLTVGVLGALALIAVAWDKLTDSSRKAMETADKLAESYNKAARVASLGIGGQQKADIEDLNKGLEQHNKWLGFIIAARVRLGSLGGLLGSDPGGHGAAITSDTAAKAAAEQQRVNELGLQNAKDNEAWAQRIKDNEQKITDEKKKQLELLMRYNELMARTYGADWGGMSGMTSAQRADWLSTTHGRTMSDAERNETNRALGFPLASDVSMPAGINVNTGLTQAQIHQRRAMGIHLQGDTDTGLDAGLASSLKQYLPANLVASAVGSLLSRAFEGVTGMLQDFFSNGKAAAEEARRMAEDFKTARASFITGATGDSFGASIAAARKALVDELRTLADRISFYNSFNNLGLGHISTGDLTSQVAAAQAAEKAQEQRITQYAQEDLAVRNMRALGQGSQADLLAKQEQQAREMQAAEARVQNAQTPEDKLAAEIYRNTLATTLSNELIAFQNGLLSTAIRNSPSGGFGIEGYLGMFATPYGPPGYPTDSGPVSGGGADNGNPGGTDWSSGKGGKGGGRMTLIFQPGALVVDKNGMMNVVLEKIDQQAGATNGAGSSRSQALDTMPRR